MRKRPRKFEGMLIDPKWFYKTYLHEDGTLKHSNGKWILPKKYPKPKTTNIKNEN